MNTELLFFRVLRHGMVLGIIAAGAAAAAAPSSSVPGHKPQMRFADTDYGRPFAKDPDVVRFKGRFLMYYSLKRRDQGFAVGIAQSTDLINWQKAGEILPNAPYEKRGLAAPCAIVLNDQVHLFYQTYGNGRKDAICHAISSDGIHIQRNPTNPVFSPTGTWNCGRAIDADALVFGDHLLLYWATRDPAFKRQLVGVSAAPLNSDFGRSAWQQCCDAPILKPELAWEKDCIEAPAVVQYRNKLYMFYAGAYNNQPQQIGCAVSDNGIAWQRLSQLPLLPNGQPGAWNSSESGHPGIFTDQDGRMYLFFQGNKDRGKTWYLSKMEVKWDNDRPYLVRPRDRLEFHLR